MHKKCFLISQVFYPDEVSTAGLFTNLCETLVKKSIDVEVWCAQPSYNTRQKQKSVVDYKGITIKYLPSTNYYKNNTIGRLINYSTFSISLIIKLLFTSNKTTVFTSTNPPFLGFLIAILATIKGRKFNYIIQDVFPDGLIKLKKIKESGISSRLWKRLNRFTLKKANKIIVIGRDMKSWVNDTYSPAITKTSYIPIWQDASLIEPIDFSNNTLIKEKDLSNKFIIQYSGNMGLWNDMKSFGLAANLIDDSNIHFLFIGDGIRKTELLNSLSKGNKNNYTFLPFQPKEKVAQSLTACHIALVSLNAGLEGIAVPSKIMGIMAAGIPVIAMVPENSEIAFIINENKSGIVIEPGNFKECSKTILALKENNSLRIELGQNARRAFLEKYSTNTISEKYINLL